MGAYSQPSQEDVSEIIYNRVNVALAKFLADHVVAPLLNPDLMGIQMIKKFSKSWDNHKIMTKWVQQLFCHLDRGFVAISDGKVASLVACSMMKFLEVGFGGSFERVRDGLLKLIDDERNGVQVDREELRNCVEVFVVMGVCQSQVCKAVKSVAALLKMEQDLSIYKMHFERKFIATTAQHYEARSVAWKQESVPEYLVKCERALEEEKGRVMHYLDRTTEGKLLRCVEVELLSKPQEEIVQQPSSGMYALLLEAKTEKPWVQMGAEEQQESRSSHLLRMHRLFTREGVEQKEFPMTEIFEQFVRDEGSKLVGARKGAIAHEIQQTKKEDPKNVKMIVAMLELYVRCEAMVKELFSSSLGFQKSMKEAFQVFVNDNASKTYTNVETLVTYCDMVLKGKVGSERLDDSGILERLDGIMRIFSFVADKDIFILCYRESLAKRLLTGKMNNKDMEVDLISKLKAAQGPPFTSKVEGMMNDFEMCADNTTEFMARLAEKQEAMVPWNARDNQKLPAKALECDATVQVLTDGFWPTQTPVTVQPRGVFLTVTQQYEGFYSEKHSEKKRLNWKFVLGNAEVEGKFPKGKTYVIKCVTLQAMALALVSDAGRSLRASDFVSEMGSSMEVMKRVLHSLSCGKQRVLKKTPVSKVVAEDDVFEPDPSFTSKLKRFEIAMASLDKVGAVKEKALEDRSFAIDAALVRTMKARKRMTHPELIAEVLHQLQNFKPETRAVKKRIECLIERDYLERHIGEDGLATNMYNYMA